MTTTNIPEPVTRASGTSLRDEIAGFHDNLYRITRELRDARREIDSLRKQLGERRLISETMAHTDLASLRRRVAFYCHPDRGGDSGLMRRINELFDMLENHMMEVDS